jgi:transcriptional antiterminator NusG
MALPEQEEHSIETSETSIPEEPQTPAEEAEETQQVDDEVDAAEEVLEVDSEVDAAEEVLEVDSEVDVSEEADLFSADPGTETSESSESEVDVDDEPEEEQVDDGRAWYVVHCYSGYENKVRHNLEQRIETMGMKGEIFDIVVPTEEEIEVKEGKRRTIERRVFPGYILVFMVMTEESWYVVRNTPGVTGFVGMGNEPTPLRPEEVTQIIKRMEADAPRIKVTFKSGERVRIVDGPFNDFRGTVSEIDMERAKVRVMVNFFGRETPVELDFLQVEKT